MDLPTYTNIWRIEKRLYKLYDLRLPTPLPIVWIGVFLGVLVPWSILLALVGLPFDTPWHVVYLVPPGLVTWLSTRPVIESKRLNELLQSQLRYLGEPKTWCRLAPVEEPDEVTFMAKVWRTSPATARRAPAEAAKSAAKARRGTRAKPKHTAPRRRPLEAWGSARRLPSVKRAARGGTPVPGEVRPAVAAAAAAVTTIAAAEAPVLVPGARARASNSARVTGNGATLTPGGRAAPSGKATPGGAAEPGGAVPALPPPPAGTEPVPATPVEEVSPPGHVMDVPEPTAGPEREPEISRAGEPLESQQVAPLASSGLFTERTASSGPAGSVAEEDPAGEAAAPATSATPAPIGTEALRRLRRLAASAEGRTPAEGRAVTGGDPPGAGRDASPEWPVLGRDRPALPGPGDPLPPGPRPPSAEPASAETRLESPAGSASDQPTGPESVAEVSGSLREVSGSAPHGSASEVPGPAAQVSVSAPRVSAPTAEVSASAPEVATGSRAEPDERERAGAGSAASDEPGGQAGDRPGTGRVRTDGREQHRKGRPPRAVTLPGRSPEPRMPRPAQQPGHGTPVSPHKEGRPSAPRTPLRPAAREQAPPLSIRAVPDPGGTADPAVPPVPVPVPRVGAEPRVRRVESVVGRDQSGGWRRLAQVVVGGGAPGRNDGVEADEARARTVLTGSRRVVVLGCTGGAGQTTTTLMLGHMLARYREDRVLAVDANTGEHTLTGRIVADSPETLTSLMTGLDGVGGYLSMRAFTTRCESGLEVVGSDSDAAAARRLADRRLFSEERLAQAMRVLDRHYRLILIDPAAAVAARVLAYADQLILVAPASEDAPEAVAMTFDWLDGHGSTALRQQAIMVINGVSRRSMGGVEQAEAVSRGRCRAIVRVPWDDELAPGRSGPAQVTHLRAGVRRAYVALAGVVASGLAAASRPSEEELAQ